MKPTITQELETIKKRFQHSAQCNKDRKDLSPCSCDYPLIINSFEDYNSSISITAKKCLDDIDKSKLELKEWRVSDKLDIFDIGKNKAKQIITKHFGDGKE